MKRLPVKSLARFRSVSKAWKSLIDSSEFIAAHTLHRHTQLHHVLVSYTNKVLGKGVKYVSYIDDDTPLRKKSVLTPPPYAKQLDHPAVLGSSHGLLCLYGDDHTHVPKTRMIVLWNPSIRKSFVLPVPCKQYFAKPTRNHLILERQYIGFGVCPVTTNPKIVSITQSWDKVKTSYHFKVMVYALSSGKWRNLSTNLPAEPFEIHWWLAITSDKFIYWSAVLRAHNIIMSFDVTNESFEAIDLPDSIPCQDDRVLHISKLRESLAILQSDTNEQTVWIMEGGAQRLFTKLFSIKKTSYYGIVGFRKSGTPMVQVENDNQPSVPKLVVYEPDLEHSNVIEITKSPYSFHVNPYMETLLLLGRSDSTGY